MESAIRRGKSPSDETDLLRPACACANIFCHFDIVYYTLVSMLRFCPAFLCAAKRGMLQVKNLMCLSLYLFRVLLPPLS